MSKVVESFLSLKKCVNMVLSSIDNINYTLLFVLLAMLLTTLTPLSRLEELRRHEEPGQQEIRGGHVGATPP